MSRGVFAGRPTVIGHRGSGGGEVGGHVENTLSSFLAAAEVGVDWVEVDVRRTMDDRLVVRHNAAYDDEVLVAEITSSEAARRGTLLLDDLIDALPDRVGIDFDLKSDIGDASRPRSAATVGLLAPVALRESARRPVAVVSFDPGAVLAMRELAAGVATGWTTWVGFPTEHAVAAVAHLDVQFLGLHDGSLDPSGYEPASNQRNLHEIVATLHAAARQLLVWTPRGPDLVRMAATGVDALCVNDVPDALVSLRRGVRQ